jgi:hypothetical protein
MSKAVQSRLPISDIAEWMEISEDLAAEIEQEYNMFRLIKMKDQSYQSALSYAFLEHILRVATQQDDEVACISMIRSESVKIRLTELIMEKRSVGA